MNISITARDKSRKNFENSLNQFVNDKNMLLVKEMRDGSYRGFTWRKFRSPAAILRTLAGIIKNPDHEAAQKNRLDALTYSNYLLNRIQKIDSIQDENEKKSVLFHLHNEVAIQYEHFIRVDPNSRYTNILKQALGTYTKPILLKDKKRAEQQRQFYLLWPLYVTGKHEEAYLKRPQFSSVHAFHYLLHNTSHPYEILSEALFKEVFRGIKNSIKPKRELIIEAPAQHEPSIDLDSVVKQYHLDNGVIPNFWYRWSDQNIGMKLEPKRMETFKIQSISAKGHVYGRINNQGQRKQLKDGWYQYVCLAEDGPEGSGVFKHDMRYFPCIAKSGKVSSSNPLPYEKYIAHSEMAGRLPVYASGCFKIEQGVIKILDDASGHYTMKNETQKRASLEYARQKLYQLGLGQDESAHLTINIMPELPFNVKIERIKKKVQSAVFGFFSYKDPGLASYCENRPRPPKKLRNLDPEHAIRSPRDEQIEASFEEKLSEFKASTPSI